MEQTRAPFGASMLVGIGWFATLVAALAVGEWSVPRQPDPECTSFGCGLTLLDLLPAFVVAAAPPLLAVLLLVTAVVTRLRIPAALAGTLSAAGTVLVVVAGLALFQVAR
ncbi:hypothetical protein Daura_13920 [Dactylosporangium aurantiacum]|uniref:Uncharacterized protein n=1 Tax=Dactylosporangium aurantiacum TaxID=35754 RepID=A0A9Q9MLP8_9ACTN|nr:hypothetical protein [Dactylosporangium aurantiacum]MDG6109809.1 hypothetical protein [Dactylosporangium aurantiacum]UWZ57161.1 hypothetical protein Daura_13920 [Dactylosporangium aurantiacum]